MLKCAPVALHTGGPLDGILVSKVYDSLLRRAGASAHCRRSAGLRPAAASPHGAHSIPSNRHAFRRAAAHRAALQVSDATWKESVPGISTFITSIILSYPFGQRTYGYDAHQRQNTVTDARNGTTTSLYNNADQVYETISPSPCAPKSSPNVRAAPECCDRNPL